MDWNAGREDDPDKAIQYKKKKCRRKTWFEQIGSQ